MGDRMLVLSWKNHSSMFSNVISTFRDKENYTDVTVTCEGKFYPAHKLVLATCSEYFEEIFQHTSCKHPVIVLRDVASKDMEALLSYMYAGVASVAQHDLASLLKAAEALCIKGLAAPDGCETQSSSSSSSGGNNTSSPKSKRRKREDSIPSATGGTNDTCNSNRNLEELSQPAVQNDHQTRLSPYNEHIESRVREEETKEIINTSRDDTRELLVDHRTPQMPEKSELECTPDMPFKDIFDDMQVKEEELDNSVDEQDLSYNSEINYHTLPDGSRQISESDVGLEDQMTQGYFSKYEAPDTNQRNLPLDSSGHVNPPHPDPGDNHKPGPSRMMEVSYGAHSR
ncbi:Longitudinals lacking protein-like 10 [Homarus americanus]|uniref:Longitudinals lacking protein-like 10 n=1 Tax=Homarus americanus TaxID=6706 RepID=A0A8J5TLE1_HOMAM|nr:Longitudinals lacking protein-like 10 [Homarus americanus]